MRTAGGRVWWHRAPLLLPLAWILREYRGNFHFQSPFSGINLVVHEAGHLFLMWFGWDLLTVAGGTLFQLLLPLCVGLFFLRQRDPFAATVAGFWLGDSLASVGPYAADGRTQFLDLVSPGPGIPIHDWGYLLGRLNLMHMDQAIGVGFHRAGVTVMTGSLLAGIWVLWAMARAPQGEIEQAEPMDRQPWTELPPG